MPTTPTPTCALRALLLAGACVCVCAAALYRAPPHSCVDIPRNMSLCHGIGYDKMRLPNLLDHDSVSEASQQAVSWVPLQNVHCHPDTRLFLCSLFSPVCLDHPIYPCRSLCERVRRGCEGRMRAYGFPWPEMFRCDKFPVDNDMCIASGGRTESPSPSPSPSPGVTGGGRQSMQAFSRRLHPPRATQPAPLATASTSTHRDHHDHQPTAVSVSIAGNCCKICNHVETYENILDNFCTADFVIRTKFKRVHKSKLICKKVKILKKMKGVMSRKLRRPVFMLDPPNLCCEDKLKKSNQENFLVMGKVRGTDLVPTFIMQWLAKTSKVFKQAVRTFKTLNCTDPKFISRSVIGEMLHLGDLSGVSNPVFTQRDVLYPFSTSVPLPSQ